MSFDASDAFSYHDATSNGADGHGAAAVDAMSRRARELQTSPWGLSSPFAEAIPLRPSQGWRANGGARRARGPGSHHAPPRPPTAPLPRTRPPHAPPSRTPTPAPPPS